jgi:hypothetical protein
VKAYNGSKDQRIGRPFWQTECICGDTAVTPILAMNPRLGTGAGIQSRTRGLAARHEGKGQEVPALHALDIAGHPRLAVAMISRTRRKAV